MPPGRPSAVRYCQFFVLNNKLVYAEDSITVVSQHEETEVKADREEEEEEA
jgi:hypothetical protein